MAKSETAGSFSGSILNTDFPFHTYDVSSGGQRFLVIEPRDGGRISVLSNWSSKLRQSTPEVAVYLTSCAQEL